MLRCPPSRIALTSSDIAEFEQRFNARQIKGKAGKVRLSPGPAHATKLGLVPAEHNIGRITATSSSSEATIHNDLPTPPKDKRFAPIHETAGDSSTSDALNHNDEADVPLNRLLQQSNVSTATPRRQVDSFYGTERALESRITVGEPIHIIPPLNGTIERHLQATPAQSQFIPRTPRGHEIPQVIHGEAHRIDRQSRTDPPLLCSARARRRQTRSQDDPVFRESEEWQEAQLQLHTYDRRRHFNQTVAAALEIPELVLPNDESILSVGSSLDPGAPVFLPRIRFGTTTGSTQDAATTQLGIDGYLPELRLRSSSDQNAHQNGGLRERAPENTTGISSSLPADRPAVRPRRRSRTADQNIAIPRTTPNLDRYPLMRPVSRGFEWSDVVAPDSSIRGTFMGGDPNTSRHATNTGDIGDHMRLQVIHRTNPNGNAEDRGRLRSVSPALSTSSRSTPNLLQYPAGQPQFGVRRSSLPWNSIESHFGRVPSVASAVSGGGDGRTISRQSSREALDAAAEFLRMRNSPLDDLTERFSRMSANRPRSVGRSWERPPRPRPSLLAGDPFRPEPASNPPSRMTPVQTLESSETALLESIEDLVPTAEDVVALAMALPPSSPVDTSSTGLPSTPFLHFSESRNPRSPLKDKSPAKSPESAVKRKPVPAATTTTPKMAVYDDSKPHKMQPQTPVDVRRSNRRTKTRSEASVDPAPVCVGQNLMGSPPAIPQRHSHRNTYPPTVLSAPTVDDVSTTPTFPAPAAHTSGRDAPGSSRQTRNQGRFRAQRSSQQAENDLEGHLHGLEEDRRTWLGRREVGNLDVTPPREGRFERYLS